MSKPSANNRVRGHCVGIRVICILNALTYSGAVQDTKFAFNKRIF